MELNRDASLLEPLRQLECAKAWNCLTVRSLTHLVGCPWEDPAAPEPDGNEEDDEVQMGWRESLRLVKRKNLPEDEDEDEDEGSRKDEEERNG